MAPLQTQDVMHDSTGPLTLMDDLHGGSDGGPKTILLEKDDQLVNEVLLANKSRADKNLLSGEERSYRPSTTASKAY